MNELEKVFNKNANKINRQILRRTMPTPEIILWSKIKNRQLGVKFRRQYGVFNYVIDFYCTTQRLAIEIDGDSHYGTKAKERDAERQKLISSYDIRFLRFTNREITENIEGVLDQILKNIL
ncbi:MAG: endonuclease domain-containing protein [Candidatus Berkelbacteria bacterium]